MAYPPDLVYRQAVLDLLTDVWPTMPAGVARARAWGADWYQVSTPHTVEVGGRVVAHVGCIPLRLRVGGQDRDVTALHSVCVAPSHRGRGYLRPCMDAALREVGDAPAILWTDIPALYTRWGFRPFDEVVFAGAAPAAEGEGRATARPMDLGHEGDLRLLEDILARRVPVSDVAGVWDHGGVFLHKLAFDTRLHGQVWHLPWFDAVVVVDDRPEGPLVLHDVLAPRVPLLAEILAALGIPAGRAVEVHFTPDRLQAGALEPVPHPDPGLMVRGALELAGAFAFPTLARC